jgi:thiol-disulfide isomerase/thioredoxin
MLRENLNRINWTGIVARINVAICFILIISSDIFSQQSNENVTISGTILNNSGQVTDAILELNYPQQIVGTSQIDNNGNFSISFQASTVNIYKLKLSQNSFLSLIIEPEEKIQIKIDLQDVNHPVITGSPQSELLYKGITNLDSYDKKLEEYKQQIEQEKLNYLKQYMLNNGNSLAVLYFVDKLDMEQNIDIYRTVSQSLIAKYPDNPYAQGLVQQVTGAGLLAKGSLAPEIRLPNPEGDTINLSSYRGKLVLIDFWAGWCGPCRMNNPHLVQLYKKYHGSGFDIFGVSLDRDRTQWLNAIQSDSLIWTQVSDLKQWKSAVVSSYNITGIPFTVLIDKDGKVIEKGLRGDILEQKLKEIYKF